MKICIDISQAAYEGTGSGRYVVELVKGLLRLADQHDYLLFGSALQQRDQLQRLVSEFENISGVSEVRAKLYPFPPRALELLWNSWHILSIEQLVGAVDLYHASDWTQAPAQAKKVTTVHDLIPFLYPEYVHPRIRAAHQARMKWIMKEVDQVIVDAVSTKQDLIKEFNYPAEKIAVIPLACDQRFFEVGSAMLKGDQGAPGLIENILRRYGIQRGQYVVSVGTLEPRKNIAKLVETYIALHREEPLVVIGKKAWVEEIKGSEKVIFTGYVPDADLPILYGAAKLFVMPSLYEGFGLPVLEAMASGVPVLCSRRSSLPEIGGDFVHYIEEPEQGESIKDALEWVLLDDTIRCRYVENAFEKAQEYSWEKTAERTLEVYKKVAA